MLVDWCLVFCFLFLSFGFFPLSWLVQREFSQLEECRKGIGTLSSTITVCIVKTVFRERRKLSYLHKPWETKWPKGVLFSFGIRFMTFCIKFECKTPQSLEWCGAGIGFKFQDSFQKPFSWKLGTRRPRKTFRRKGPGKWNLMVLRTRTEPSSALTTAFAGPKLSCPTFPTAYKVSQVSIFRQHRMSCLSSFILFIKGLMCYNCFKSGTMEAYLALFNFR